jgi:putative NADH-flavin reductase
MPQSRGLVVKVALVGATGFIGSKILAEAVNRGHYLVAICRHPENVLKYANAQAAYADVMNTAALQLLFAGQDAVIHSYSPPFDVTLRAQVNDYVAKLTAAGRPQMEALVSYRPSDPTAHQADVQARIELQTRATQSIIRAAEAARVPRILAVGGAGTLLIGGVRSMDRPEFPVAFEGGAKSTAVVKELLREHPALEWTVLCPSTIIQPGQRTGKFRLGHDDLLTAAGGLSRISVEDFAMAFIDELEAPKHTRQRFTVGY